MKIESVLQITEADEPLVKYDMGHHGDARRPAVLLVIGGVLIVCANPDALSDIADISQQAENALRDAQELDRVAAEEMDAAAEAADLDDTLRELSAEAHLRFV